ncbi:CAP domain-containing protein [Bacillus sp. FJAT-29790]|uniref:CAP domain-containing protein n=1 Tax=Bacillus sp. FJAT-29790 TaxID=1895002 RepID=UPI001C236608|nr:CAP domain-containing protein [Bacillus sp. FJAT-29790]MBU8878323.1 CAP domain-containing protein [Bacillus sp. FJAT-29790]
MNGAFVAISYSLPERTVSYLRKFFRTLLLIFILFISWPFIEKQLEKTDFYPVLENTKSKINAMKENPHVLAAIDTIYQNIFEFAGKLDSAGELLQQNQDQLEKKQVKKPNLATPADQVFSIHNIEIGDKKEEVESQVGSAKRSSYNEYGTEWQTYHENYQNFLMVAYDEKNHVAGLYTNQDLIASVNGLKRGSPKDAVLQNLGKPLTRILKGMTFFQFQENRDYDVFLLDDSYVTIFYDKHENNTVTAIQIINKQLEQNKKDFYTQASDQLKEGFEYQLFDLTNADRVNHHLPILKWNDQVKETARKHSDDMAEHNYFSHTNLVGQSPFDRMGDDHISFTAAGENLATGQFSSIFAHEGLMNSLGHRENILRSEYQFLGVGVAFNTTSQPYYTENFFKQ